MRDDERAGDDPRFHFMSAILMLAACLFVSLWWGRTFVYCGVFLALVNCGQGCWRLYRNQQQRKP